MFGIFVVYVIFGKSILRYSSQNHVYWQFSAQSSTEDREQRKALLPLGLELQISKLFQRGMWFELMS